MGLPKELAMNCACEKLGDDKIILTLSPSKKHLLRPERLESIEEAIRQISNKPISVTLEVEESDRETPADCLSRLGHEQFEHTKENFKSDPGVKALIKEFGATLNEESIKPL